MMIVLSLNNRYGKTAVPIEYIIGKSDTFLISVHKVTVQTYLAIGNFGFHRDSAFIPLSKNGRSNILQFYIFFRHILFCEYGHNLHLHFR